MISYRRTSLREPSKASAIPVDVVHNGVCKHRESQLTNDLTNRRKLRVERPVSWPHHRSGWADVVETLEAELHCPDGVRVLTSVEEVMVSGEVISEPWVGFVHEVPHHTRDFPDLERLLKLDSWSANIGRCLGLWTLSRYQKRFLASHVPCPVAFVWYPTAKSLLPFDFARYLHQDRRTVLHVGEYLRNFKAFADLECPTHRKVIIGNLGDTLAGLEREFEGIDWPGHVSDRKYDELLATSIVFLNLIDAPANTTIIECIRRGTPVLVNRVGGVEEYLGRSYPFYYKSLAEAQEKLADDELIAKTVLYLRRSRIRKEITHSAFICALQNTAIYRSLPVPRSQESDFPTYDVTVLVCSYDRTADLPEVLARLSLQDFKGRVEVIVWNNNPARQAEVDRAIGSVPGSIDIKVVHSSENFYCIVRLAVASLMRSERLLICDDDVLPEPNYVSRFVKRSDEVGTDTAVCARGNRFLPHTLDEEDPAAVWTTRETIAFYDESDSDRLVHYMHADACLIPRGLLSEAVQYEMPRSDFALVDDYWLSFVLSNYLGARLLKIKCDDTFSYSQSSDNRRIALSYNPRVQEEVVNVYVHHMRAGWPWPATSA